MKNPAIDVDDATIAMAELGYPSYGHGDPDGAGVDERLAWLRAAYARGRGGNNQPLFPDPQNPGATLQSNDIPLISLMAAPEAAQCWLVNVLGLTSDNRATAAQLNTGQPPRASVYTNQYAIPPASPLTSYLVPSGFSTTGNTYGIYLRWQYGTAYALEMAWTDYPYSGLTYDINAAIVRLNVEPALLVPSGGPYTFPRVGAFASPGKSRGKSAPQMQPTFTPPPVAIARLGGGVDTVQWYAPPRAVGYRAYIQEDVASTAALTLKLKQVTYFGTVTVQEDAQAVNAQTYPAGGANGAGWFYSLHPGAVAVAIQNQDAVNSHIVGIQWYLDLG